MKKLLLVTLLLLSWTAWSQTRTVTGKVTSSDEGMGLPGVNVIVQGTNKGTTTDAEGNYSIQLAESETTLVFSFVGYSAQTVQVDNRSVIDIELQSDVVSLSEIVVVGYGTQREQDLTSAISTVKTDELVKTPTSQAMQALQGKVPGMQVVSAGAPGASPTVRIRGLGSYPGIGSSSPLYVVDGMFFDNIDFLNPNDIATISILKDASSAAIFGVRAANGVVLIETKSGKVEQKAQITYSGYYGVQRAQNVLQMANAEQFTNMALESGSVPDANNIRNAMQRFGRSRVNPNVPDVNTDWYKEILRTAPIQNHSVEISGGNSTTSYSVGGSYFAQEGIMNMKNDFERFNLRTRVDYDATSWLKVGGNVTFSNASQQLPNDAVWNQVYYAVPILPVYDPLNTAATPEPWANAQTIGYRQGQNPFPSMRYFDDFKKNYTFFGSFYAKLTLIPDKLSFQSTYNGAYTFMNQRTMNLPYYIGDNFLRQNATLKKRNETTNRQFWDNVLTFEHTYDDHYIQVMAGTSFRDESWQMLTAAGSEFVDLSKEAWYLNFAGVKDAQSIADDGRREYGISYFSRVAYTYRDKYILFGSMRADGSSKFQETWGYFPSIGAGWVLTGENFMDNIGAVDFFKIRGSWGEVGNDKIDASDGSNTTTTIVTAINDLETTGLVTTNTFDYLKWERVAQWNIGFTGRMLKDRLSIEADYYTRDTKRAAIYIIQPMGGATVRRSVGVIRNKGIEVAANWSDSKGDFRYNIGANITTLRNVVRDLYGQAYIDGGSAEFRQRSQIDNPLVAFFGYEVAGVYQNDEQIQADPIAVANGLVPGDLMFKDQNGDGVINDDDRTMLGSFLPKISYGANFGFGWRNLDLSVALMGQYGNKILNRKRGEVIWTPDANVDADLAKNRWHGEGTSNSYPSSAALRKGWNQKMSDFFVEDGSFFRIQNVTLGYTVKDKQLFGATMPETRIILTAERPLTLFNYNGFNPEVENGIDLQTYPIPAVYTIGLNVKL